jgi:hypothetical protein
MCAILALLIAVSLAFATDAIPVKHQGAGRIYEKEPGFSIVPPKGWTRIKNADAAFMTIKDPKSEVNVFNARSIKYDKAPVEDIGPAVRTALGKMWTEWKFIDESYPTLDGKKCYMLISQMPKTIKDQKVELQSMQYLIPTNRGIAFVVTFTTKASAFEQQRAALLAAANSIRAEPE